MHPHSKDHLEIAEKVRTGEYFREARAMYDLAIHDPMAERYMYVFITVISVVIFLISLEAMDGLYPLNSQVPLIFYTNDIVEDLPHIQSLITRKGESPGEAVLRMRVEHYVTMREEYDISTFDRDVNGIKSETAQPLFNEFQKFIDPRNAESPITLYQRHSKRKITVLSSNILSDGSMDVFFAAQIEGENEDKLSHWKSNVSFQYSGIEIDEKTGRVKPVTFVVTKYHSKRLQDEK